MAHCLPNERSRKIITATDSVTKLKNQNNLWGMQRSVSFFLVGADGAKSCKRLKHIWQLQQSKKRLIHWYRVIQQSRLCYCFTMQPVLISFGDSYLDKYIWCLMCSTHGKFYKWLHWLISLSISIASGQNWLKLTSSFLMVIIHMIIFSSWWSKVTSAARTFGQVSQGLVWIHLPIEHKTSLSNVFFVSLFVWLLLKFPKNLCKIRQQMISYLQPIVVFTNCCNWCCCCFSWVVVVVAAVIVALYA